LRTAIEAIGEKAIYSSAAEAQLLAALAHPDQDVRGHAAWGLGKLAPASKAGIPLLIKTLSDPIFAVQHNAAWALAKFGQDAKPLLVAALRDPDVRRRVQAAHALLPLAADLSSEIQPVLLASYDQADSETRGVVLTALGQLQQPSPEVISLLGTAVAATDPDAARLAVLSLGRLGAAAAPTIPAMLARLGTIAPGKDKELRGAIVAALAEIRPTTPAATAALTLLLDDDNEHVAAAAADSLSKLEAYDALASALHSKSSRVRQNTVQALAAAPELNARRVELLLTVFADKDQKVRMMAVASFHGRKEPAAQAAIPALAKALRDVDANVQGHARTSLEEIGSPAALRALKAKGG
jgi:HEAT repeat protein